MSAAALARYAPAPCTISRAGILGEVVIERWEQLQKWGEQSHPDMHESSEAGYADATECFAALADNYKRLNDESAEDGTSDWTGILLEEIYEALTEAAMHNVGNLRTELVQSAAVITAWIEDIDSRG